MSAYITLEHLDQTVWSLIQKINTIAEEPHFYASPAADITSTQITNWDNKPDTTQVNQAIVNAINNIEMPDLSQYFLKTYSYKTITYDWRYNGFQNNYLYFDLAISDTNRNQTLTPININYNGQTSYAYISIGSSSNDAHYQTLLYNLSTPTVDHQAVNKAYVDNAIATVSSSGIQTIAINNNTEYSLIGTLTTNNNTALVSLYQQTPLTFSKTTTLSRLTIGSTSLPGHIRLYSNVTNAQGYTDLVSGATGTNERTITFPDKSGTVALTSDIPTVYAWAKASTKPTYTAAEVGATTSSDVSSMIASAVSGITSFSTEIVQSLPASGVTGRIYFLAGESNTNDIYEEYIYVNNTWEKLGNFDSSAIDLSDYLKTTDLAAWAKASTKPTYTAAEVGALASNTSYVTSFNGQSGAITYIPPVTSVNGQTGAVTVPTTTVTQTLTSGIAIATINGTTIYAPSYTAANGVSF